LTKPAYFPALGKDYRHSGSWKLMNQRITVIIGESVKLCIDFSGIVFFPEEYFGLE